MFFLFLPQSAGAQSSVNWNSTAEHCGGAFQLAELPGAGEVPIGADLHD